MTRKPEGYSTITPYFIVDGAIKAIELYKKVFGAVESERNVTDDQNKIMHSELNFFESKIFVADTFPEMGFMQNTQSLYVYLSDVDSICALAKENGFVCKQEPADMFWGDRMCQLVDPFGNTWNIATHKARA